jgi:hypothetical protein
MKELLELFNLKHTSKWFIIFIIILFIYILYQNASPNIKESFGFVPWNMGTRFYPSYDLRGYPQTENSLSHPLIFPWNWNSPMAGMPPLYWSPFFYGANGKYRYNPKYANNLNYNYKS